jgi:hypothetical protein
MRVFIIGKYAATNQREHIFLVCYFMFCIPYCHLCSLIASIYLLLQVSHTAYIKSEIVLLIVLHTDEYISQKLQAVWDLYLRLRLWLTDSFSHSHISSLTHSYTLSLAHSLTITHVPCTIQHFLENIILSYLVKLAIYWPWIYSTKVTRAWHWIYF